ncbi:MAG: hypothetical protein CMI16_07465 [Opitutaceae bacterium]|nr:hypothetical protein [Opitutaceae bacterium]
MLAAYYKQTPAATLSPAATPALTLTNYQFVDRNDLDTLLPGEYDRYPSADAAGQAQVVEANLHITISTSSTVTLAHDCAADAAALSGWSCTIPSIGWSTHPSVADNRKVVIDFDSGSCGANDFGTNNDCVRWVKRTLAPAPPSPPPPVGGGGTTPTEHPPPPSPPPPSPSPPPPSASPNPPGVAQSPHPSPPPPAPAAAGSPTLPPVVWRAAPAPPPFVFPPVMAVPLSFYGVGVAVVVAGFLWLARRKSGKTLLKTPPKTSPKNPPSERTEEEFYDYEYDDDSFQEVPLDKSLARLPTLFLKPK